MTRDADTQSTAQLDRLGERLRAADTISEEDLLLLQRFRQEHVEALRRVQQVIVEAVGGAAHTSRIKTIQTLHDKLRRQPTKLSRVQGIAGVRIVKYMDRLEQDEIVRRLVPPATHDRRRRHARMKRGPHSTPRQGRTRSGCPVQGLARLQWAMVVNRWVSTPRRSDSLGDRASLKG